MIPTAAALTADDHKEELAEYTYPVHGINRTFFYRPGTSDEGVIQQIFKEKVYELDRLKRGAEIKALVSKILAAGKRPLIVDGGANIGCSPVYFADIFPDAHVLAVEPEFKNLQLLFKNCDGLSVEWIEGALSSEKGQFQLIDTGGGHWTYRAVPIDPTRPNIQIVERTTMNDIYAERLQYQPFIVKLDIEGGEQDVFSKNTEWVAKTPVIMIEIHDWILTGRGISRPFLQCISALDRDFVHIGETIFSISNNMNTILP